MTPSEFQRKYTHRIRAYACLFAAKWSLPSHVTEDLEQACWLGILESLPYWRPATGSKRHKSAFNWCAGPMRRAMERYIRSHHGYRPCSKTAIKQVTDSDDFGRIGSYWPDLENSIDLYRALENDPKPKQVARFVLTTINPNEQSDVAQIQKVTRQAICLSVRTVRERLRLALA